MSPHRRTWWAVAAAALVASACSDGTAPQLSNPQQLASDLQTVSTVFASPAFQSFGALDSAPGSPIPASAPAGALLGAARVAAPSTARQPYADAPARLQAWRTAASVLSSPLSAQVIPSPAWGKTYVWDGSAHRYAEDPNQFDASRHGVRVILYAVNPITHHVVEPAVAVGFVDLLDESAGNTNQLHVIVKGGTPASPGTTYVDYTISATVIGNPASAFSATAVGYVSDATHRVDFNATFSATNLTTDNPDAQADVHWALDTPVVIVDLHETVATPDANHATLSVDVSVTRGTETVRLSGTISVVGTPESVTADLTVSINGAAFARISGTADATHDVTIAHVDGTPLSQDELQTLRKLFDLPDRLEEAIEHLFHPAKHYMGA